MKKRNGLGSSLAQDFFHAEAAAARLEIMLGQVVSDIVGIPDPSHIWFDSLEEEVTMVDRGSSFSVTEEGQRKIYELGFKRICVIHNGDATHTSYHVGGDARGYRLS